MTRSVKKFDRVVVSVRVSVKVLWIAWIRHNSVWTGEPSQRRVIPPCPHLVQPQALLLTLSCPRWDALPRTALLVVE